MGRDLRDRACRCLNEAARDAPLLSARPIVLVPMRGESTSPPSIAPGLREIGVMLPSTPLHVLLLRDGPPLQVMTSGNVSDEPVAMDDDDACLASAGSPDLFLLHDRRIHTRVDDSVVRLVGSATQAIRRARGFVPGAISLLSPGPSILAVGADLKNSVCVTRDAEAFLSQHIGDLASPVARDFFEETIGKLCGLLGVTPAIVAHDLHPEYAATRWAMASRLEWSPYNTTTRMWPLASRSTVATDLRLVSRSTGRGAVLRGILLGGERSSREPRRLSRAGHLRPIALAGGEAAIRQPWRLGLAALLDAGAPLSPFEDLSPPDTWCRGADHRAPRSDAAVDRCRSLVRRRRRDPRPPTRSLVRRTGRDRARGRRRGGRPSAVPIRVDPAASADAPFVIDLRPTVLALADDAARGVSVPIIAATFHETMARAILASCRRVREACDLSPRRPVRRLLPERAPRRPRLRTC